MIKVSVILTICSGCLLLACTSSKELSKQKGQQVTLTNTATIALKDKAVIIKRSSLNRVPKGTIYPLIMSANNDTIYSQLDDVDGDNNWDELFLVANLPANSTNTYTLTWLPTMPNYRTRTSVRFGKRMSATEQVKPATSETVNQRDLPKSIGFQRYQTDGPSWENDKVGFRHYLDGRNAKDVFGKLVPYMSPETVGINAKGAVEDNYHVMEKWGRDILAVGNSIGIGGVALVDGDNNYRLGVTVDDSVNNVDRTTFNIVSEGPVRSILKFKYNDWRPTSNRRYNVEETTSIWPGMFAYHNSVKVSGLQGTEKVGIGMVNINSDKEPTEIRMGNWVLLVSHDKHTYNKEWWLGLALILPADAYDGYLKTARTGKLSNTFLAKLKATNGEALNYFAVAGWELSDVGFRDPTYFENYVKGLAQQIAAEVTVTVK